MPRYIYSHFPVAAIAAIFLVVTPISSSFAPPHPQLLKTCRTCHVEDGIHYFNSNGVIPRGTTKRIGITSTTKGIYVRQVSLKSIRDSGEQDDDHQASSSISSPKDGRRTERQIKQLSYVMVHDVEDLLKSSDTAPEAPARALANIERLEQLYDDTDDEAYQAQMGDLVSSLVRAYAKSGVKGHARLAEETFRDMKSRGLAPSVATACAVIDGYARTQSTRSNHNKSGPLDAERLLFELMDDAERAVASGANPDDEEQVLLPTSACCNACIKAWARQNSREGAERAQGILDRMEYLDGTTSSSAGGGGGGRAIHPTVYSYATVVTAWNRGVGGLEAAERAEQIIQRLLQKNEEVKKARAKARRKDDKLSNEEQSEEATCTVPNTVLFNAVIDCWAQSSHPAAGTKGLDLLKMMKELGCDAAPDAVTYRSVINAFAGSSHINAAKSAEEVMELANQDGVIIDTRTYNVVLKAWSSSTAPDAAKRAEQLLVEMIEAQKSGDIIIGPDAYSWSTVLSSLAKSSDPGKARRARDLLTAFTDYSKNTARTGDDGSRPNTSCYNTVLNACAFSAMTSEEERKEALRIAVQTLQEVLSSDDVEADSITYGTMLKAIANLVPSNSIETRNKMATKIFERCASSGFVNGLVLKEFKRCVSNDCLLEVTGDSLRVDRRRKGGSSPHLDRAAASITLSSLPKEWKANVSETRKGSRRRKEKEKRNDRGTGKSNQRQRKRKKVKKEDSKEEDSSIFHSAPGFQIVETSWQSGRDV